jgi:glycosyltransferase involved in cell wall biosynthesis
MDRIRVLHFVESGGLYGAENVILNLSLEMQRSGAYEPIVGCIIQDRQEVPALCEAARSKGIRTELFYIKNVLLPLHYIGFLRRLKAVSPDIIHCHGYKPTVYAYLASRIRGISLTATCHLWYVDDRSPRTMRWLIRLEKILYRRFPMVFAVSPAIRDTLLSIGMSELRVRVVNNGISLPDYEVDKTVDVRQIAGRIGIEKEICIVNVGRLTHQKSQKTIVDAAQILRSWGRCYQFIIAGDGELRDELQLYIAQRDLCDYVKLVGFTDRIVDLFQVATVFVLPSRDEGMPMSLLEAVACRVPVIATNVGAVASLIKHRISGLLIPVENPIELAAAIEEIVENPAQSKSFSEEAYRMLASTYSSDAMFKEYDRCYRSILHGKYQSKLYV